MLIVVVLPRAALQEELIVPVYSDNKNYAAIYRKHEKEVPLIPAINYPSYIPNQPVTFITINILKTIYTNKAILTLVNDHK